MSDFEEAFVRKLLESARLAYRASIFDRAKILCHCAILQQPSRVEAYEILADILIAENKREAAKRICDRIVSIDSKRIFPHLLLAKISLQEELADRAIGHCLEALKIFPGCDRAYLLLWSAFCQQNCLQEALSAAIHFIAPESIRAFSFHPLPKEIPKLTKAELPQNTLFFQSIYPQNFISLKPVATIESKIDPCFTWGFCRHPEAFVLALSQGRAWADAYGTSVFAAGGQMLPDVSQGSWEIPALSDKLPACETIKGTAAFLSVRGGNTYYHWMADLLPRIGLLQESQIDLQTIDRFIVTKYHSPYQKETLALLEIPAEKIIDSSRSPHLRAERLVVPSLPGTIGSFNQHSYQFLRKAFLDKAANFITDKGDRPNKIYLSRKNASYRRVPNEEELVAALEKEGFVCIFPEKLSFLEQVALFASAKAIVAPHGAALANIIFCQPETQLVEFFSPDGLSANYWMSGNLANIKYYYLLGGNLRAYCDRNGLKFPSCTHPIYKDIVARVPETLKLIDLAKI